ncbi:MAG: UbiA family prenyltransferase [Proteobacteria bacterium]|nr:UbiA family prenyltransferase [Pseudomonadota bacterium]
MASAVAFALVLACGRALGSPRPLWSAALLGACGTACVYNVDRLRDRERDRSRSPDRTRFVEQHRAALIAVALASGAGAAVLVALAGLPVLGLCAGVLAVGLFHRRLKERTGFKNFYVASAWTVVAVGLPALALEAPRHIAWVATVVASALAANLLASNAASGSDRRRAAAAAIAGVAVACLAPRPVAPLALLPGVQGLALLLHQPTERSRLWVVDGALGLGAGLVWLWPI